MYNFLSKNGQLGAFLLGVVLVVIYLAIAGSGAGDYFFNNMSDQELYAVDVFNFGIAAALLLTGVCVVLMFGFGLYHVATNPKGSIKGIIGVLVIVAVMYLFYVTAADKPDHETLALAVERYETSAEGRAISAGNFKWIGSSIRMGLVMAGLAFVALIVMPIISPIVNRIK
jgi:hypothetical protein